MKIFGAILIAIVTGTMFLSLFHMSMGMDMAGGMTDCPFASQGEVICSMSIADHLDAWKTMFLGTVSTVLFLLAGALLISAIAVAPHLLVNRIRLLVLSYVQSPIRTYTYCYRALQELFSRGILHPKLF